MAKKYVIERKSDSKKFTQREEWTDKLEDAELFSSRDAAGHRSERAARTRRDGKPEPVRVKELKVTEK